MDEKRGYFIVDKVRFDQALKRKGFKSYAELSRFSGIHRNTIGNYLSGDAPLPESLEKLFRLLDLTPQTALTERVKVRRSPAAGIAKLIDNLSNSIDYPYALGLFGSRARNQAKAFSDYDLGVYSSLSISFSKYSKLIDIVEEWNDNELSSVQIVNLNNADSDFLEKIGRDIIFLAGSYGEWIKLLEHSGVAVDG